MDNRPIGVMDSGIGGLTVVRSILELCPRESICIWVIRPGTPMERKLIHGL